MFKLHAYFHMNKKLSDYDMNRFLYNHPCAAIFLCGFVVPITVLLGAGILSYLVLLPISIFMGWV